MKFNPEYILYILLVLSVAFTVYPSLEEMIQIIKVRLYALRNRVSGKAKKKKDGDFDKLQEHLKMLLVSTLSIKNMNGALYFEMISLIVFAVMFLMLRTIVPVRIALAAALITGALPYLMLRILLQRKRQKGSREGDELLSVLIGQYKINYRNMEEAIERAAGFLEDAPVSQKAMYRLARELKTATSREEINRALVSFNYNYKTNWSAILIKNMHYSLYDGIDVTESLEDLLKSIDKARKIIEHTRRQNSEAGNMLKFLAPASYLLTVFAAVKYFGFTVGKFFDYQFRTESGMKFFLYFTVAYVISICLAVFYQNRKMDL